MLDEPFVAVSAVKSGNRHMWTNGMIKRRMKFRMLRRFQQQKGGSIDVPLGLERQSVRKAKIVSPTGR